MNERSPTGISDDAAIAVDNLHFTYSESDTPALSGLRLIVPRATRCLLVGANGAGKTTLLSVLAGRHMVPEPAVRVLSRPAFTDTSLVQRVSFIGGAFPLDVDVRVSEILERRPAEPARRDELLQVLGVQPTWRMCRVSDGQRRRVQILLGLLSPCELLLLDEVTTDLDVIARSDLLSFLRRETEQRGTTILYATHILEGLEGWASHLAFIVDGKIRSMQPLADIAELEAIRKSGTPSPLLRLVEGWLRAAVPAKPTPA